MSGTRKGSASRLPYTIAGSNRWSRCTRGELAISGARSPRSLFEGDPEAFRHAVQRAAIDAHDLRRPSTVTADRGEHVPQIAPLEIVERGKVGEWMPGIVIAAEHGSGRSPASINEPRLDATTRSMVLRSSRTLPGQRYINSVSSASAESVFRCPALAHASSRKWRMRSGMSALRSRSGGTRITMTLRR